MSATEVRFRHGAPERIATVVLLIGTIPVATLRWWLLPLLAVPLAVIVYAWRAGTDLSAAGVTVRALVGVRRVRWPEVAELRVAGRRIWLVRGDAGSAVRLPALRPADLPHLRAAAEQLSGATAPNDAVVPHGRDQ